MSNFDDEGKLYGIWASIKSRCYNKKKDNYKYYGLNGITICKEWKNNPKRFIKWSLINGYKKGLWIDRINPNKNYTPDNCRFVKPFESAINRKMFDNNKSGYVGINKRKINTNWNASIGYKGDHVHIGYYKTKEEALIARNEYIKKNKLPHKIQELKI